MAKKSKKSVNYWLLAALAALVVVLIAFYFYKQSENNIASVDSDDCITHQDKQVCSDDYEGLTLSDASEKAKKDDITIKIRERDGDRNIINNDFGGIPIYLTLKKNIVTKAEFKL